MAAMASPPVLASHRAVRNARGLGMIWAFDIETDVAGFSGAYHRAALAEGLLLRPIGNTLYFMPPYILDDAALEQLAHGALRALDAVLR